MTDPFLAGLRRGEMAADHFTIVSNLVARDPALTWGAKGLFLNMASHREGFPLTEEFLASQSSEGVKRVRTLLGELRERGYVYRGARGRYPAGTRNAAGKDISGALGAYTWFVTDKPDEIAVILGRYATEQHALNTHETAGQDYLPHGHVVPTSTNTSPARPPALPPQRAGSDDQAKQGETAGRHNRPVTTVVTGTSKEDHHQKTNQEDQAGGETPPPAPRRPATAGDAARVVATELNPVGDPPHARELDDVDEVARAISQEHPDLGHGECHALAAEQLAGGVLGHEQAMLAIRRTLAETTGPGQRRRRRTQGRTLTA